MATERSKEIVGPLRLCPRFVLADEQNAEVILCVRGSLGSEQRLGGCFVVLRKGGSCLGAKEIKVQGKACGILQFLFVCNFLRS